MARNELSGRVDALARLAEAKAAQAESELAAFVVHEDYDAVDCDGRHRTRAGVQAALSRKIANSFYVLATWEIEAWMLLFPYALAATRKGWAVPPKHLGRDTARIEDPKRVLTQEVSKGGPRYRESDAPAVLGKAADLGLLTTPTGRNRSWQEFTAAIAGLRPGG